MKFMTQASVKNLPNYLADDRKRSLLRREEERYQEEKNSRKKFAEFTSKLQDITAKAGSREELIAGYDQLKQEYSPYLEPEWMQKGAQAVRQWQEDQFAQENRDKVRKQEESAKKQASLILDAIPRARQGRDWETPLLNRQNPAGMEAGITPETPGILSGGQVPKATRPDPQTLLGAYATVQKMFPGKKPVSEYDQARIRDINSQIKKREWEMNNPKAKTPAADGTSLSITDQTKIQDEISKSVLANNGITYSKDFGFTTYDGTPVTPEQMQSVNQEITDRTSYVLSKMTDGANFAEALQLYDREKTKTNQDNSNALRSAIQNGDTVSLTALSQNPERLEAAIVSLAGNDPDKISEIVNMIRSILQNKDGLKGSH